VAIRHLIWDEVATTSGGVCMHPFFEAYLDRLQGLHDNILQAIEGLPPAALDWIPGPDMNSIAVLVVHTVGAERYWVGDVVARDPSGRDRTAEFRAQGLDAATLKKCLNETLAHTRGVLEGLTLRDLEAIRISPRDGREYTVAWALAHALEHTAMHVGHIQITRQLWEQRSGNA
jgi:uncharacterized damage-inducible protein DinB